MNTARFFLLALCWSRLNLADAQEVPQVQVSTIDTINKIQRDRTSTTIIASSKHPRRKRELKVLIACLAVVASALVLYNVRSR